MKELVIVDNTGEKIVIKADNERFALVAEVPGTFSDQKRVIILSPRQAEKVAGFITKQLEEVFYA